MAWDERTAAKDPKVSLTHLLNSTLVSTESISAKYEPEQSGLTLAVA